MEDYNLSYYHVLFAGYTSAMFIYSVIYLKGNFKSQNDPFE